MDRPLAARKQTLKPGSRTNLALLASLLVTVVTGALAFAVGVTGPAHWLILVHDVAGVALVLLIPWKSVINRRGLRRAGVARRIASVTMLVLVLLTLGAGVLHAVGGFRTYLGLLPMQLHVGAAVAVALLLVAHLLAHRHRQRFRPRRVDLSRRTAVRSAGLIIGATGAYLVLPGLERRANRVTRGGIRLSARDAGDPMGLRPGASAGPASLAAACR